MKKNDLTTFEYVAGIMIWGFVTLVWYERLVFSTIPGVSNGDSYRIYLMLTAGLLVINMVITMNWYRNVLSAVAAVLIPFGVYTCVAYVTVMPVRFKAILVIVGVLSVA